MLIEMPGTKKAQPFGWAIIYIENITYTSFLLRRYHKYRKGVSLHHVLFAHVPKHRSFLSILVAQGLIHLD